MKNPKQKSYVNGVTLKLLHFKCKAFMLGRHNLCLRRGKF